MSTLSIYRQSNLYNYDVPTNSNLYTEWHITIQSLEKFYLYDGCPHKQTYIMSYNLYMVNSTSTVTLLTKFQIDFTIFSPLLLERGISIFNKSEMILPEYVF